MVLKAAFWLAVLPAAVCRPAGLETTWRRVECALQKAARRPLLCCVCAGLLVLGIRGALLPVWPMPQPVIYDEFGYLLQADTFAAGRLTNAPHALWPFFESVYLLQQPTYNAKYPPGQGLMLGIGERVAGHAWFGVWLSCALMAGALCWALYGWLPPGWALFGSLLSWWLCIFSYWVNSYWGGAMAAMGGALVLGAYPRMVRRNAAWCGWWLGLGLVLLALTRMYEGLLFALPILLALAMHRKSVRFWVPIALVAAAGAAFFLHYNQRVTGDALRLPYAEYQRQYGYVPPFNIQPLNPAIRYRNLAVANVFQQWEFEKWMRSRTWLLLRDRAADWFRSVEAFSGGPIPVFVLLAFGWAVWRERRMRIPALALGAVAAGSLMQIVYYSHYAAPATAAVLLLTTQAFRHLRHWRVAGRDVGRALARMIPAGLVLVLMASTGERIYRQETPEGTQPVNARRQKVEQRLREQSIGRHLIVVRYTRDQVPHEEWVYNRADIDGADVVWAHDLGTEEDRKLTAYFHDRRVWLFEPDEDPEFLKPFPQ